MLKNVFSGTGFALRTNEEIGVFEAYNEAEIEKVVSILRLDKQRR